MSYDPNDPNRVKPGTTPKETYVEPVERKSSALPLIIGVLLALALAYFVLQRFMADDTTVVEGDTTTVTTTERQRGRSRRQRGRRSRRRDRQRR